MKNDSEVTTEAKNGENLPVQNELVVVIESAKVEKAQKENALQAYQPFMQQLEDVRQQSLKIDFASPTALDSKIARGLRLELVSVRTSAEKKKKERKETIILLGNLEDHATGVVVTSSKLMEAKLLEVEKFAEIRLQEQIDKTKAERLELLAPFEVDTQYIPLGTLPQEDFNKLLADSELLFNARIEAENKKRDEQIAREKAEQEDKAEQERRQNSCMKLGLKFDGESFLYKDINFHWTDLRTMSVEAFDKAFAGAEERMAVIQQEELKAEKQRQAELDKAKKDKATAELKLKKEKEKSDALLAEQQKAAETQKAKQEAELQRQRQAAAKKEAELKAENDRQAKLIADQKAKEEEERKQSEAIDLAKKEKERQAALAPDREKLLQMNEQLDALVFPHSVESDKAKLAVNDTIAMVEKLKAFIIKRSNEL